MSVNVECCLCLGLEKDIKKLDNSGVKDGETGSDSGKKKGKEERPPTKVISRIMCLY